MADDLEIPNGGKIDNKLLLSTLRDIRRDQRETRELLLTLTKHVSELEKRLARRVGDVTGDLEIRPELMGRLANFETRIDQKFDELLAQ